jgi:predicted glycosyl hydrolase (DUF1957 family)
MNNREQYIAQKDRAQRIADFYNKSGIVLVMIFGPKYRGHNTTISIIGSAISHAYLDLLKMRGTKFRIIEKIIPRV